MMNTKDQEIIFLKTEVELKRKDIFLLVAVLRDIYANRGEDQWVADRVQEAIENLNTIV